MMLSPGATTSGFSLRSRVGPYEEEFVFRVGKAEFTAPTVMTVCAVSVGDLSGDAPECRVGRVAEAQRVTLRRTPRGFAGPSERSR